MTPLTLGPILGHVSHDAAKIWFEAAVEGPWLCHVAEDAAMVRPVPGSPCPTRRLSPEGSAWLADVLLPVPDTAYTYDVRDAEDRSIVLAARRPLTFRAAPAPGSPAGFSFAFASCHGPHTWRDVRSRYRMWRRLDEVRAEEGVRFLLQIGDQVYAEDWYAKAVRMKKPEPGAIEEGYRRVYRRHWRERAVGRVLERMPSSSIWDDHEITDGWGSSKTHFGPQAQGVFQAARAVYREFQHSRNPQTFGDNAQHYAFGFGPAGFLVLDLRGHRKVVRSVADRPLMGKKQWEDVEAWLAGPGRAYPILFVVASVPVVHAPAVFADLIGGIGELDLRDQWTYKPFRREQQDLVSLLFRIANDNDQKIVILGGDAHVGAVSVLRSRRPAHRARPAIHQFTSSPIAHTTSALANRLLRIVGGEIPIDRDISGRILHLYTERNFGIVRVERDRSGRYLAVLEMHREGLREPDVFSTGV